MRRPVAGHRGRYRRPGFGVEALARLDLRRGAEAEAAVAEPAERRFQARHRLAGKVGREPGAGIQCRHGGKGGVADHAGRAGGPPQLVIVKQDGHAVAGQHAVELDPFGAQLRRLDDGRQRVFRGMATGAPMADDSGFSGNHGGRSMVPVRARQNSARPAHRKPIDTNIAPVGNDLKKVYPAIGG